MAPPNIANTTKGILHSVGDRIHNVARMREFKAAAKGLLCSAALGIPTTFVAAALCAASSGKTATALFCFAATAVTFTGLIKLCNNLGPKSHNPFDWGIFNMPHERGAGIGYIAGILIIAAADFMATPKIFPYTDAYLERTPHAISSSSRPVVQLAPMKSLLISATPL